MEPMNVRLFKNGAVLQSDLVRNKNLPPKYYSPLGFFMGAIQLPRAKVTGVGLVYGRAQPTFHLPKPLQRL